VTQTAISCAVMRGGTSKGMMFLADDLPGDRATRDAVLLAAMDHQTNGRSTAWEAVTP